MAGRIVVELSFYLFVAGVAMIACFVALGMFLQLLGAWRGLRTLVAEIVRTAAK